MTLSRRSWASVALLVAAHVLQGCSQGTEGDWAIGTVTSGAALSTSLGKDPGPRPGAPGAGAPPTQQPIAPDSPANQAAAAVACYPGLSPDNLTLCAQAVIRFQELISVSGSEGVESGSGLGPTFNANGCATCHSQPNVLGSSPGLKSPQHPIPNPQVALATEYGAKNHVPPFITPDGPVREVRSQATNGVIDLFTIAGRSDAVGCTLSQPDFNAASVSFRIPTPTFGLGLVEATDDETLQRNVDAQAIYNQPLGITPVFNRSGNDGTITRFGWKAQNKSLLVFAGEAYNVEIGVTSELFPNERASSVASCLFNATPEDFTGGEGIAGKTASDAASDSTNFAIAMRLSAPPVPALPPGVTQNSVSHGSADFGSVGCANCHSRNLTTSKFSIDPAMANVEYHPYSDFALHHMGSGLADGITQGNAGPDQFRTAPLWGVGQRLFFLHDGRTQDLGVAIEAHASPGSEANAVIAKFNALTATQQQDIIHFLRSL